MGDRNATSSHTPAWEFTSVPWRGSRSSLDCEGLEKCPWNSRILTLKRSNCGLGRAKSSRAESETRPGLKGPDHRPPSCPCVLLKIP